jgi:BirA family biotin operon repressor/biotin-[acetyl-CoA-carboxylase] ligase
MTNSFMVISLPRTGSTNDVLKELAATGAPEGTVVIADEQTAGRGRFDRRWLAPPGTCLLLSILFRPSLPASQVSHLTMLTALAATDAIETLTGLKVALKWPNDLIVPAATGWRKLAGMLTETSFAGQEVTWAVVGIGINVNVPPAAVAELAADATSILAETGQETDRAALLQHLLAGVERRYARLRAGETPCAEWASRLATLGQRVQVDASGERYSGTAEAVDEDGALLLRTDDGHLRRLLAGDVTLLRPL